MSKLLYFVLLVAPLCALAIPTDFTPGPTVRCNSASVAYCTLTSLSFSNFALSPAFSPTTYTYSASVAFTVSDTVLTLNSPYISTVRIVNSNFPGGILLTSNSGSFSTSPIPLVVGLNSILIDVLCVNECNFRYVVDITRRPEEGGQVVGDPQFTGLKGQSYQIHGVSGEVYNIVSDPTLQYNSRFVFLDQGECPIVNGKKQKGCWSHPGSYLGELGIKTKAGDLIHVVTGPAKQGFAEITVNGKAVDMGETIMLGEDVGSVTRNSTHSMTLRVDRWTFDFENSDMFLNQRVEVRDMKTLRSHGLLGQTWREKVYPNAIRHIQGEVDDYVIRSGDIYGDDFVFNQYN